MPARRSFPEALAATMNTNFGHREDTFQNPVILQHMLDGIQYALGDLEVDATPTAKESPKTPALAPAKSK